MPRAARVLPAALRRWPRTTAAAWFAVIAALASAALFLSASLRRDSLTVFLYIVLPTLSGLVAGAIVGPILGRARTSAGGALIGVGAVAIASAVFAPLFTAVYAATAPGKQELMPLVLSVIAFIVFFTGILIFPIGAVAGLLLVRFVHREEKDA